MAQNTFHESHYETVKEEAASILDSTVVRDVPPDDVIAQRIRRVIEDAARFGDVDPKLLARAGVKLEPASTHDDSGPSAHQG